MTAQVEKIEEKNVHMGRGTVVEQGFPGSILERPAIDPVAPASRKETS